MDAMDPTNAILQRDGATMDPTNAMGMVQMDGVKRDAMGPMGILVVQSDGATMDPIEVEGGRRYSWVMDHCLPLSLL